VALWETSVSSLASEVSQLLGTVSTHRDLIKHTIADDLFSTTARMPKSGRQKTATRRHKEQGDWEPALRGLADNDWRLEWPPSGVLHLLRPLGCDGAGIGRGRVAGCIVDGCKYLVWRPWELERQPRLRRVGIRPCIK
jgi:hypothetical protein